VSLSLFCEIKLIKTNFPFNDAHNCDFHKKRTVNRHPRPCYQVNGRRCSVRISTGHDNHKSTASMSQSCSCQFSFSDASTASILENLSASNYALYRVVEKSKPLPICH